MTSLRELGEEFGFWIPVKDFKSCQYISQTTYGKITDDHFHNSRRTRLYLYVISSIDLVDSKAGIEGCTINLRILSDVEKKEINREKTIYKAANSAILSFYKINKKESLHGFISKTGHSK